MTDLNRLAGEMRANSERWFPGWHSDRLGMPLRVAYTLGLAGEVGEVANVVKKLARDGESPERLAQLGPELADCFTYLLLLAQECEVDLVAEYEAKVSVNEARWGVSPRPQDRAPRKTTPPYNGRDRPPPFPLGKDPRKPECEHEWSTYWGVKGERQQLCPDCERWIWDSQWRVVGSVSEKD